MLPRNTHLETQFTLTKLCAASFTLANTDKCGWWAEGGRISVCLSVFVSVCLCYSREGRRARKGGCPPGPRIIIEGGHGPTLRPRGRLSTCLMGGEGVLTLAVGVFVLL